MSDRCEYQDIVFYLSELYQEFLSGFDKQLLPCQKAQPPCKGVVLYEDKNHCLFLQECPCSRGSSWFEQLKHIKPPDHFSAQPHSVWNNVETLSSFLLKAAILERGSRRVSSPFLKIYPSLWPEQKQTAQKMESLYHLYLFENPKPFQVVLWKQIAFEKNWDLKGDVILLEMGDANLRLKYHQMKEIRKFERFIRYLYQNKFGLIVFSKQPLFKEEEIPSPPSFSGGYRLNLSSFQKKQSPNKNSIENFMSSYYFDMLCEILRESVGYVEKINENFRTTRGFKKFRD